MFKVGQEVWNFCNAHGMKVYERERRFCTAYDMHPYLRGSSKEGLHLHSQTIQAITEEYVTRRSQFNKVKLRWRTSRGSRRSLGWIPFKASAISYKNGHHGIKAETLAQISKGCGNQTFRVFVEHKN
jgi:hypothetical protein